jgi:hypothetical protein
MNKQMFASVHNRVHKDKNGFLGPGKDQDIIGRYSLVKAGDFPAQFRVTGALGIAQTHGGEFFSRFRFQSQQFPDRESFAIRNLSRANGSIFMTAILILHQSLVKN